MATVLLLVIAAYGFASAEGPKAKASFCNLTDAEIAGVSVDASVSIHAIPAYRDIVRGLFQAGRFAQLDCLAESVRSRKETFSGGLWKIHTFYKALEKPPLHATQEDWDGHMQLLNRWMSTNPESITARIALAESYVSYGWDARGAGYADTVSGSGWKLLEERAAKAKQILDEAATPSAKDPEWYVAMQQVALAQGWDKGATRSLLEQAVRFEPTYYYYYREYAYSIMPRWGGEEGEVDQFLTKTADNLGGDTGDMLYFRVATYLICDRCDDSKRLKVSWRRIQKGFVAVEKHDGPSPVNWNVLAHMGAMFMDPEVANQMFARIGDEWDEEIWQTSSYFESTKQWAKQVEPFMVANQAAEKSAEANLQTTEGQRYKMAFDEKIHSWMQPCVEGLAGSFLGNFELLIKVGKEGTIEYLTGRGYSPVMACLGPKLDNFRMSKQDVFPATPQPDYWVRFDFNPEKVDLNAQK